MAMDRLIARRAAAAASLLVIALVGGCQGPAAQPVAADAPRQTPATTSESAAATAAGTTLVALPPASPAAIDSRWQTVCERFRSRRGEARIGEGRFIFAHCLPGATTLGRGADGLVRDFDRPTFDLSRDALLTLLGEPDAIDTDAAVYELGERHGRRHVLHVQLADGRVASSSLMVWY